MGWLAEWQVQALLPISNESYCRLHSTVVKSKAEFHRKGRWSEGAVADRDASFLSPESTNADSGRAGTRLTLKETDGVVERCRGKRR